MRLWAVPIKRKEAKWCNSCKTVKPVAQFSRDRSTPDGLDYRCRPCNTIHSRTEANKKRKLAAMEEFAEAEMEAQAQEAADEEADEEAEAEAEAPEGQMNIHSHI